MTVSFSVSHISASELVDLAWELTCSVGVVVKIDQVVTDHGVERCVSARCVPGSHPFMLIPRGPEYIEVWWGERDHDLYPIGVAADIGGILALASRAARPLRRIA